MTSGSSSEQAPKTTRSRARKTTTATVEKETKPATKRTRATKATKPEDKEKATGTRTAAKTATRTKAAGTRATASKTTRTKTAATRTTKATDGTTAAKSTRTTTKATKASATKSTRSRAKSKASAEGTEPTIAQLTSGEIEVEVQRDGNDVVLKVGGKKRSLDEVDDSQFVEEKEATLEKELVEEEGFSLSDQDDADEPEQQVVSAGATADPVKDYLKQIGKVALLNAVQEVELAKRIEAGLFAEERISDTENPVLPEDLEDFEWIANDGRNAKNHLLEANLRLVVSLAKRYTGRGMLFLDLIQEGNLGLIRAVEKFDYTKGFKFSTYATWWVRQAISRGIAQQGRIVRLPVHVAEQVNQVSAVRRNLERALGREPEVGEIADELNLAEEKVIDLIRYARDHVSLDAPVETDGDTALGDLIARETAPGPDEVVLDAEERARLDGMLSALDDRSADVVRRRYGLLDGRQAKLADIGQHWGITAERVRQIERLALAKMREYQAAA